MPVPIGETFQTHVIYRKEVFFKAMAILLIILVLYCVALYGLKNRYLSVFFLWMMWLPLVVLVVLFKRMTLPVSIHMEADRFTAAVMDGKGNEAVSEFELNDLLAYRVGIPTERFMSITFKRLDGSLTEYSFFKRQRKDETIGAADLVNAFHELIGSYNGRSSGRKIVLLPSFYASSAGLWVITGLSVLLISGLTLASVYYHGKALPFSFFFGLLLIGQLIWKRKNELDYYKDHQAGR